MKISANKVLTRNPKIRNTPPPSESLPISGDWDKLGIPNLAGLSLMKSYRMLQNVMVTAFTVAEVLRENPKRRGWGWGGRGMNEIIPPPHTHTHTHTPRLGLNGNNIYHLFYDQTRIGEHLIEKTYNIPTLQKRNTKKLVTCRETCSR